MARTKQVPKAHAPTKSGKTTAKRVPRADLLKRGTTGTTVLKGAAVKSRGNAPPVVDGTEKPRKPHRFRSGTVAVRQIATQQKSCELLIPRTRMNNLIREIAQGYKNDLRFQPTALFALHEAAESMLVRYMRGMAIIKAARARKRLDGKHAGRWFGPVQIDKHDSLLYRTLMAQGPADACFASNSHSLEEEIGFVSHKGRTGGSQERAPAHEKIRVPKGERAKAKGQEAIVVSPESTGATDAQPQLNTGDATGKRTGVPSGVDQTAPAGAHKGHGPKSTVVLMDD